MGESNNPDYSLDKIEKSIQEDINLGVPLANERMAQFIEVTKSNPKPPAESDNSV